MKQLIISLFPIILLFFVCPAFGSDEKSALTPEQIIAKHIEAVGGKEALQKIKSRVAIGTARKEDDAVAPIAIMSELPNRVSAIYQFVDFNWQMIYDGSKALFRPMLTLANAPVMIKYQDMLSSGTMFNDISLYNIVLSAGTSDAKFEMKGTKKIKGRSAYVINMKRGKKDDALLYFDTETFMWVRTDYGTVRLTKQMGQFTNAVESKDQERTYDFYVETSDFRDVDGIKLPFKMDIVATAPLLKHKNIGTISATFTEYRHNIPIDPKMYQ